MEKQARNDAEVRAMIMPALKQAAKYVAEQILIKNEELIQQIVYDAYDPVEYDRTGEFKKAWDTDAYITGNVATGEFWHDSEKMNSFDGHHASVVDGQPMRDYLAEIIYEGLSGAIYQEGYAKYNKRFKGQAWTKKRDVWKALLNWLKINQLKKLFEEGLRQQGISFTRTNEALYFDKE